MAKERVLVGMSGGVDSSLTAALLVEQGYDVIGATLRLYDYEESLEDTAPEKRDCHPASFIEDAKNVAAHLGIEHHVIDQRDVFQNTIISPFKEAYAKGRTPLPCVRCNRDVKTAALYALMQEKNATRLATGHYVRSMQIGGVTQLHQGMDTSRDQSFFLFGLAPEHVAHLSFPLGHFSKEQTRLYAQERGLSVAQKAASQDLCFISKRTYHAFVGNEEAGPIIDHNGHVLGQHKGISFYTIGQRQGLGMGGHHEPLYVVSINAAERQVVVGPRSALAVTDFLLEDINWLAPDIPLAEALDVSVKIRSSGRLFSATLTPHTHTTHVHLQEPDYGIAPGQACVFYRGTRLLGGGWIKETRRA